MTLHTIRSLVKEELSKLPLGNLGFALEKLGKELLLEGLGKEVKGCNCKAVLLLVLAGCYYSPDNLFYLAALFNSGILLPKHELLVSLRMCMGWWRRYLPIEFGERFTVSW